MVNADQTIKAKRNKLKKGGSLSILAGQYDLNRHELTGKTLAILSLGHVDRIIVKYAEVFGMKVIGYDHYLKQDQVKRSLYDKLEDIF